FVPSEMSLIQQDAHKLGNCHGRVSVVKLNGDSLGKLIPISVGPPKAPHHIGQRARDQKVFLHEAQPLSHAGGVVGIEHAGEGFGGESLGQRTHEITTAEFLKIEVIGRGRSPEAERVNGFAAVAYDGAIEWDTEQSGRLACYDAQTPALQL